MEWAIPLTMVDGEAVLTTLLDVDGNPTDYPPRCAFAVGFYLDKRPEGKWFYIDLRDAEWEQFKWQ